MSLAPAPVSDMLVAVKSREIQRGLLAEMRRDPAAARDFLAAAHLELVRAEDYAAAGEPSLGQRSRISAASCFWRAGQIDRARQIFTDLLQADPSAADVQALQSELEQHYPSVSP